MLLSKTFYKFLSKHLPSISNFFKKMPQTKNMIELLQNSVCNHHYKNIPLLVIIGATGCGKTKLSIELARKYGGEIISADSMQVCSFCWRNFDFFSFNKKKIYKGLDIATNKATIEEQSQVPHHLLDQIDPFTQFTVVHFQKIALEAIHSILKRNKIPIIVGGTNYYIESILWNNLIQPIKFDELIFIIDRDDSDISDQNNKEVSNIDSEEQISLEEVLSQQITWESVKSISNERLYSFVMEIDPEYATILHPNNRRKLIRDLQVYQQTGRKMSDILAEQRNNNDNGSRHGGSLRFVNSIILWVDCEKSGKLTK